jgi:hypothetical protein
MNPAENRDAVEKDLRRSPNQIVIYVEGKSDVDYLFGLLGRPTPVGPPGEGLVHRGVLVKGCNGAAAVKARAEVGSDFRPGAIVIGIIDGDGLPLSELAATFDAPHQGPWFSWKAYCIENLLAKTGWPSVWGNPPDLRGAFRTYGPYVALNQLHLNIISMLKTLKIAKLTNPPLDTDLKTDLEVIEALEADKHLFQDFDVAKEFRSRLLAFQQAVDRDLDEAHALLNGKWLVEHFAPTQTGRKPDQCKIDWIAHAVSVGGLAEVRDWWERVIGSPP